MKYATVNRDGFGVPLIVIPFSAVVQECDLCHDEFGLTEIEFNGSQSLCRKCRVDIPPPLSYVGGG